MVIVFLAAVAFGRLAVVGARDAQLAAGEEATWSKPGRRGGREEKPAKQDQPAMKQDQPATEQDGERPSVWRRLTAAR